MGLHSRQSQRPRQFENTLSGIYTLALNGDDDVIFVGYRGAFALTTRNLRGKELLCQNLRAYERTLRWRDGNVEEGVLVGPGGRTGRCGWELMVYDGR